MKPIIRDRAYLSWLRTQPCLITGLRGTETEGVDPCHIGTAGKGIKSSDDEALPISHAIHQRMHSAGEITTLRRLLPDYVLRQALRAYARECYREWKDEES